MTQPHRNDPKLPLQTITAKRRHSEFLLRCGLQGKSFTINLLSDNMRQSLQGPRSMERLHLNGAQLGVIILRPQVVYEGLLSHLLWPHAPDGVSLQAFLARPEPLWLQDAVHQLHRGTASGLLSIQKTQGSLGNFSGMKR